MSFETVKARLAAAKDGPWTLDSDGCCVYAADGDMVLTVMGCDGRNHDNAPVAAHAPADLEAALKVIEAVKRARVGRAILLSHNERCIREDGCSCVSDARRLALRMAEFEALP